MCKNPSIAVSSIRPYIYNCKFITSVYQCQQNNRKTVFVIEKLGAAIWKGLSLHVFSVDNTNAIREVPQVPKVIHDLRPSCACRGWHNFMFWVFYNGFAHVLNNTLYSWVSQAKAEWNSSKIISCSKISERNVMKLECKVIDNTLSRKYFSKKRSITRTHKKGEMFELKL